jgi:Xaa-Pro aminopeptidase
MAHAPTDALSARHQRIRQAIARRSLDALVVTALPNITYLTNFAGSAAIVVLTADRLVFLTDFRYATTIEQMQAAAHACPDLELVTIGGSYDASLADFLARLGGVSIGFEAAHLTVSRHQFLEARLQAIAGGPTLVPTEGVVEAARAVKDRHEIAVFREAGARLSEVARRLPTLLRAGQSERAVASAIDLSIREAGFERPAFETIVAGGPNAALPHARPSERTLSEGDLVVLDFGGVYDSYCVDLTRTLAIGRTTARSRDVHAAVLGAHDRAIAAIRPGVSRFAIDAAARDYLADAGMAEAFGHGTGHGLGIEVHEDPRIVRRRPDIDARHESLTAGMVFTIEPGAYFPGWGGVRIEDDVLVTDEGVELLTDATHELLEVHWT